MSGIDQEKQKHKSFSIEGRWGVNIEWYQIKVDKWAMHSEIDANMILNANTVICLCIYILDWQAPKGYSQEQAHTHTHIPMHTYSVILMQNT